MFPQPCLGASRAESGSGAAPVEASAGILPIMARATRAMIDCGAAGRALKAGDAAPGFALDAPSGARVWSTRLLDQGPLVVSFHRGTWCPCCNRDLQALQAALPQFRAAGAGLVAISPQHPDNSGKSARKNAFGFPILSDPRNDVAAAFGLRFALPAHLVAFYKTLGNRLPAFNGGDSWTLPIPARFVIGQDGIISYAEVTPDPVRRPAPADMLPAIRRAAGSSPARRGSATSSRP